MNIPKISIIVPIYNVEEYLDRCITSLLNQTLKDIEIILVDDESPDNCGSMCDKYAMEHENIKVIHKKNGGLGYARNSGLEIATGEYVGFIDSDDFVDEKMYETLYNFAKQYDLDATISAGFIYFKDGITSEKLEISTEVFFEREQIREVFIPEIIGAPPTHSSDVKYAMSVCRGIYSLKQIRENNLGFLSERDFLSEDILFNISYLSFSRKVGLYPKSFYYYCYNKSSITRTYREDYLPRMSILYEKIKELTENFDIYKYAKFNIDRLYLLMTRGFLRGEFLLNKDKNNRRKQLKKLTNDEILKHILRTYPSKSLPIKHRLFFLALKYRQIAIISLLYKFTFTRKIFEKG